MHKKTVIDFKENGRRLIFQDALVELKTRKLEEVPALIRQVEAYQAEGFYVVGYLSYEAAPAFDPNLEVHHKQLLNEYLLYFTVHKEPMTEDFPLSYAPVEMPKVWESRVDADHYKKAIEEIHRQIRQGNTYQVNYTIQLEAEVTAHPWDVYQRLMVEQEASYNAYIETDDFALLSISPELFFQKRGQTLITRPMKGTTKRALTRQADLEAAAWLQADPKNRAENMMIVDLLRNDMNRICQIGSVRVEQLCQVEQYSTVWQMTSTIMGDLDESVTLLHLLQALFPCGSITGAPKISTMHYIKQLEEGPRGVYCGTVGFLKPGGDMIFNVPIRTLQIAHQEAIYGVGGGITWDSSWQDEYEEVAQKAAILKKVKPSFQILTSGLIKEGQLVMQEAHFNRLQEAAAYFTYPFDAAKLKKQLEKELAHLDSTKVYKLRILLDKAGTISLKSSLLTALDPSPYRLKEQEPLDLTAFHFFKTSHRPHLRDNQVLYYNQEGHLLETSIANLLLEKDGHLYTPPKELGILQGLYLKELLSQGKVEEKFLYIKDLEEADNLYTCNSVRGIFPIEIEK